MKMRFFDLVAAPLVWSVLWIWAFVLKQASAHENGVGVAQARHGYGTEYYSGGYGGGGYGGYGGGSYGGYGGGGYGGYGNGYGGYGGYQGISPYGGYGGYGGGYGGYGGGYGGYGGGGYGGYGHYPAYGHGYGGGHGGGLLGGFGKKDDKLLLGAALVGGVLLGKILLKNHKKRDLSSVQTSFNANLPENSEIDPSEMFNFIVGLEDEDFCMPRAACELAVKESSGTTERSDAERRALKYLRSQPSLVLPQGFPRNERLFSIGALLGRTSTNTESCRQLFTTCKRSKSEIVEILDQFVSSRISKSPVIINTLGSQAEK